jgi:3-hydroxyisobutyrate dehydrogenase-like beta-hydroxyacid dehydrogenase
MPNDDLKISLIGLGNMGSAIGEQLLAENFKLSVYNRTPAKANRLVALGATFAPSLADACTNANIVITALFDDAAVLETTRAIIKSLTKGAIHIGTSTILPDTAKELTKLHDTSGSTYIGGAILGVPPTLKAKSATTLAAGPQAILKVCEPVFKAYSARIIEVGDDAYLSNVMKICANYLLVTSLNCMGELYTFAEKSGLATAHIQSFLHSVFAHKSFTLYADKILNRNFDQVNFSLAGGYKDASLFAEAFNGAGLEASLVNLIKEKFASACATSLSNQDWSAVTEITRKLAGLA